MATLFWIIIFCLVGGVLSVLGAAWFLALSEASRARLLPHLLSFATGALLGAAFMALLPHALQSPEIEDVHSVTFTVLFGVLGFFILEKLILWRHCHDGQCELHEPNELPGQGPASGIFVLIGDSIHNLVDGMLIAAAFMSDFHLGVVTAIAVVAHEVPQEVGDFGVLLYSGFGRRKALLFNLLSSLTTVVGGLVAYYSFRQVEEILPYALAIAAASFIYVAMADLIPGMHRRFHPVLALQQVALFVLGVAVIFFAHGAMH